MTSAKLDSASLGAKLSEFVAALPVGNEKAPALPFVMINDCAEKLTFEKKAKLVRLDMMGAMIAATALGTARTEASKDTTRESTIWCRDAVGKDFTAYRPNQRKDTFVVAFNDAGLAATVGEVDFGGLIKLRNGHFVSVSDGVREEILPPFEQMPTPEQVAGAIGSIAPITTFDLRAENDADQTIIVPPR